MCENWFCTCRPFYKILWRNYMWLNIVNGLSYGLRWREKVNNIDCRAVKIKPCFSKNMKWFFLGKIDTKSLLIKNEKIYVYYLFGIFCQNHYVCGIKLLGPKFPLKINKSKGNLYSVINIKLRMCKWCGQLNKSVYQM